MIKTEKKEFLYIGAVLLALLAMAVCINLLPLITGRPFKTGNRLQFLGVMSTLNILFWGAYKISDYISQDRALLRALGRKRHFVFIENHAPLLLFIFITIAISWLGFVIFRNPYIYSFEHGDAGLHVQLWHNLCSGLGPENSLYYNLYAGLNMHNPTFYSSIFSVVSCWLPILILTPLYCLYPYPPMHVFAVAITVISLGAPGIYMAIRAMRGSKTLSLSGAIGYCVIPAVELPMLHKGDLNNLGFAVYPYVFAFLFSKKWGLFYVSAFLLSLMSTPYTYSVMALGIIIAVFFNARKQAVVVFLIGLLVMTWDKAIWDQVFRGLNMAVPDFFTKSNMTLLIPKLLKNIIVETFIILISLMTVAFLPLFGIRRQKKWNWPIVGMLFFALIGAAMEIFRGTGWVVPRSNSVVVPLYLSAFMAYLTIFSEEENLKSGTGMAFRKSALFGFLLFSGIVSMSLWFTIHYPWRVELKPPGTPDIYSLSSNHASVSVLKISPNKKKLDDLLGKINEFVPHDASIAFRVDAGLEAFLTNRQKAWLLGSHPEGVEYYIVQTKAINEIRDIDYPSWQESLEKVAHDNNMNILYENEDIIIYRNMKPVKIPRLENVLGWDIILKTLLPGKEKSPTK